MAMLKNKHITFSLIFMCLIVVSPVAKAQLGSGGLLGGGLGGLLDGIIGIIGKIIGGILSTATINGRVFCTPNGSVSDSINAPAASALAFPNAGVQLQCGRQNTVVSTTTTNAVGEFSLPTEAIQMKLSTLLSTCRVVVTTSLATCNASLPKVGNLVSQLTVIGSSKSPKVTVVKLAPNGFSLIN